MTHAAATMLLLWPLDLRRICVVVAMVALSYQHLRRRRVTASRSLNTTSTAAVQSGIVQISPPRISAIICTRNRPDMIREAVGSVLANRGIPFELIVIDQSDTDASRRALSCFLDDRRLRYVHTTKVGLSAARNAAAGLANARYLAFTDDDCEVPSDWLEAVTSVLDETPEASLCYGTVRQPAEHPAPRGGTPCLYLKERRLVGGRHSFAFVGMGANMAMRKDVFEAIDGFDELLGAGAPLNSAEECDFQYRAHRNGLVTLLEPSLQVVHFGFRTNAEWKRLYWRDGYGIGAFFMKHIRCGDTFALWALTKAVSREAARAAKGILLQRDTRRWIYVAGIVVGTFRSVRFGVNRRLRLYVAR